MKQLSSPYAFVLTGTPLENRIDELYSIVEFLNPQIFGPLFRFNREFYELDDKGRPAGYKNLKEMHRRIRPILMRRRKDEVEEQLPGRTVNLLQISNSRSPNWTRRSLMLRNRTLSRISGNSSLRIGAPDIKIFCVDGIGYSVFFFLGRQLGNDPFGETRRCFFNVLFHLNQTEQSYGPARPKRVFEILYDKIELD